jgi:DNA mismatch repair protein MutS2
VILEELARKHSFGIVTTHYLNLKVMANKTPGIINGAMAFDEEKLMPLYRLTVGKPGSSYTFSIAERIGLDKSLIQKARQLVESYHFRLDKLLNRAEQDQRQVEQKDKDLTRLIRENEKLKTEMEALISREKHRQQIELLRHQNMITDEKLAYLKDTERKLKQIAAEWKKAEKDENKTELIKQSGSTVCQTTSRLPKVKRNGSKYRSRAISKLDKSAMKRTTG